jgi:hypothetical protein
MTAYGGRSFVKRPVPVPVAESRCTQRVQNSEQDARHSALDSSLEVSGVKPAFLPAPDKEAAVSLGGTRSGRASRRHPVALRVL